MKCLVCNNKMPARVNKKFCSDACRVYYHNARLAEFNTLKRKIHTIIGRNRKILKMLFDIGKTTVSEKELMAQNLNFEYFTSQYITATLRTYYYCYDFGYCKLDNDKYLVVKNIREK